MGKIKKLINNKINGESYGKKGEFLGKLKRETQRVVDQATEVVKETRNELSKDIVL
ncbi:MAG TPA: hypothetical protein LFW14_00870 [Rickettsia endosymbiont of Degeeriella rufa]|nr:hypothetical protein [Rickettsia endosymbiont of Degeeriella rufa]